jgi:hypothetical protein
MRLTVIFSTEPELTVLDFQTGGVSTSQQEGEGAPKFFKVSPDVRHIKFFCLPWQIFFS